MATEKTRSVSGRVPVSVADKLEADATELGMKPGTLLRTILEGRYRAPSGAGNSDRRAGKSARMRRLDELEDEDFDA